MPKHEKNIIHKGTPLAQAQKAMIMVHGRGASAPSILTLAAELKVDNFALLAPQASQNTWYPYSFLAPKPQNEPGLSSALRILGELLADIKATGITSENIYFVGFSQGACLTAEFVAQNADKYGGVFILSGGLIGDTLDLTLYKGDLQGTPVLLGCSDIDPHIPLARVQESEEIFIKLGGAVTKQIYPNAPHTVFEEEIAFINQVL